MGAENTVASLPDADTAYNTLFQNIDQRVFFHKLAAAGYVPRNEKEAQDLLDLRAQLAIAAESDAFKAAEAAGSPYAMAKAALDQYLGESGVIHPAHRIRAQEEAIAIQKTARDLAQDPLIYNSVLVLKAAEAAGMN